MNDLEYMSDFEEQFGDTFVSNTKHNPLESILHVLNYISENTEKHYHKEDTLAHILSTIDMKSVKSVDMCYPILVDGVNLINWIYDNYKFKELYKELYCCAITGDINEYNSLRECADDVHTIVKRLSIIHNNRSMHNRYDKLHENEFIYKFSEESIARIQTLVNELRDKINASNLFEDKHKQRLLKRLEKLQAEMHKEMSDVDRFWGLIGDAGVVIGKFGENAKPFVDRIVEISQIVCKTQAKYEKLTEQTKHPLLNNIQR